MSNNIGFQDRSGSRVSERLGTNGSSSALVEQFLVGYAAGGFPQAARARSAVRLTHGFQDANPDYKGPGRFTTSGQVKDAIALDGEDCYWTGADRRRVGMGWFASLPACPIYRGVLIPILLTSICDGALVLSGNELRQVAAAWRAVLVNLQASPAVKRLTTMADMAEMAMKAGSTLEIG